MGNSPDPTTDREWGLGAVGRWGGVGSVGSGKSLTNNNQQSTINNQPPTNHNLI
ncbi:MULTISPECIES: hypothetical protein [Fischerella]|uniref:hypothetical protein n=1 Tax=Fischerella TaxID=1190 RepID=UPI00030E54AA|nr:MULTISPECIES: hypothetical protein [Fischerella]MBD2433579.1 hypothetical protein [Fischerella sp. FACHB-380]